MAWQARSHVKCPRCAVPPIVRLAPLLHSSAGAASTGLPLGHGRHATRSALASHAPFGACVNGVCAGLHVQVSHARVQESVCVCLYVCGSQGRVRTRRARVCVCARTGVCVGVDLSGASHRRAFFYYLHPTAVLFVHFSTCQQECMPRGSTHSSSLLQGAIIIQNGAYQPVSSNCALSDLILLFRSLDLDLNHCTGRPAATRRRACCVPVDPVIGC